MGKRRTKTTEPSNPSPYAGDAATAVMERRRHGSKSSQLDWIHLVNGQRLGESIPPTIVNEVACACDLVGDSWALLMADAKDLSAYLKFSKYTPKIPSFTEEHGTLEELTQREQELKASLEDVQEQLKQRRLDKSIDDLYIGQGKAAMTNNPRLFPNKNDTLLSEAGVT